MCGLVGLVCKKPNGFSEAHKSIFSALLFVDTLRGRDSTGVFQVSNQGDVTVAKEASMAPIFMSSQQYRELLQKAWNNGAAMIGHNRAATKGSISDDNAHPFNVEDNIFLVHNGTMRSDHKKHADVEVDSHAIAHLIHEKKTVAEALGSFYGAYALIWYDIAKQELNLIRNDERPLYWMELEDAWVWASEASFLEFAVGRVMDDSSVKVVRDPTSLPKDVLQTFTLNLERRQWEVKSEKLEIKKEVYYSGNVGSGGSGGGGRRNSHYYEDFDWDNGDEIPFGGGVSAPFTPINEHGRPSNGILSEAEFEERLARSRERRSSNPVDGFPGGSPRSGDAVLQLQPRSDSSSTTRPSSAKRIADNARRLVGQKEPVEFPGTEDRERAMAAKLNKIVPHGEYVKAVIRDYPYNIVQRCTAFDYALVNGKDTTAGFYLYATPLDDDDILIRMYFPDGVVTEERMIQLAGSGYIYDVRVTTRSWKPLSMEQMRKMNAADLDKVPGYVVIRGEDAKLIAAPQQRTTIQ